MQAIRVWAGGMMMHKKNDMREKEREGTFLHRPNQSIKQASWPASSLSDLERIWSFISPTLKSSKWVLFFLGLGG
ncbi:unnamed protein product, partial [Sphagnum compactum]